MTALQAAIDQFSDYRWRLNNLYWITSKDGQRIQFRTNTAQEQLLDNLHYCNVILKARQLGFSTLIQLIMLDACVFNSNVRAGTIAHTREDAEAIFRDKAKYPYDNLPEQIRPGPIAGLAIEVGMDQCWEMRCRVGKKREERLFAH